MSFVPFGRSIRAGLSEKWHSNSLRRWMQIVQGCSPLHFCLRRLQLSQARLQRRRRPEDALARCMVYSFALFCASFVSGLWLHAIMGGFVHRCASGGAAGEARRGLDISGRFRTSSYSRLLSKVIKLCRQKTATKEEQEEMKLSARSPDSMRRADSVIKLT